MKCCWLMVTGAYKTHLFVLKLELGAHDAAPSEYAKHIHVEYTLANSLVSRAQVRSISLSGQYYEEPPDRWVRQTRGTVRPAPRGTSRPLGKTDTWYCDASTTRNLQTAGYDRNVVL